MSEVWDFDSLYEEHASYLLAFVRRLLYSGNLADVEDIAQETWLRAFRRRETFGHRSSFRTWLFGIAFRCAQERAREAFRRRRESSPEARLPVSGARSPADRLTVDEVLASLNPTHRAHLLLSDVYGYSHQEIEEHFGILEATSRTRLFRARESFRRHLAGAGAPRVGFKEANE